MISKTAEYALRIMVVLQQQAGKGPVLARKVSEVSVIPSPYVSIILHRLRHAGYVTAGRGPGGGYELAVPAKGISVLDIISVFDNVEEHRRCVLGHNECDETVDCPVHAKWSDILNRYDRFLCEMTLDRLAGSRKDSVKRGDRRRKKSKNTRAGTLPIRRLAV